VSDTEIPTGLVIVDHGSRLDAANAIVETFCVVVWSLSGGRFVAIQPAHMELATPSLDDAVAACVERGAERVVVAQFFLVPGRHSSVDIPKLATDAAATHNVEVLVTEHLEADDRLAEILLDRVDALIPPSLFP
jgi:sirohydrochlorin ferrochelatase